MTSSIKRIAVLFCALVLTAGICGAFFSYADAENAQPGASQAAQTSESVQSDEATQAATDCSVTLKYFEAMPYDDPDAIVDDEGRRILGERTLSGYTEGQVLSAWDFVVDIPGHFFFDAFPGRLTVSADPSKNVIEFVYGKLWNTQYTVNYYVMTGADLTADNWTDALAPENVEFIKIASETFTGQRFDALVEGDAYEYQVDGMYVIDTYPAEIRLGTDPDNNVINVLYTPTTTHLPDDIEIVDKIVEATKPEGEAPGTGEVDEIISTPTLPSDTTMNYDDLIATLPDDVIVEDFAGSDDGTIEITDEMLAHPVDKEQAQMTAAVYKEGLDAGSTISRLGDEKGFWALIAICVACACVAIFASVNSRSDLRAKKTSKK